MVCSVITLMLTIVLAPCNIIVFVYVANTQSTLLLHHEEIYIYAVTPPLYLPHVNCIECCFLMN